jgi:hypothetical protein
MQAVQKSATPELNEKYFPEAPADAQAAPPAKSPESGPK